MSGKLKGKNFWNSTATEYHSGRTKSRKHIVDPALFDVIGKVSGKRVLDVACGAGDISIYLAQKGAKCVGIDYSKTLIQLARQEAKGKGLDIDFRVLDAREIQKLEEKFDLALITLLFPHLPTLRDIAKVVTGVSSVLKEKGRLVIAEPHPTFDFYMRKRLASGDFQYFAKGLPYDFQMDIGNHSLASEAFHWALEDYSHAIFAGGFVIRRIIEPQPLLQSKKIEPVWYREKIKYPPYIIFDCLKY